MSSHEDKYGMELERWIMINFSSTAVSFGFVPAVYDVTESDGVVTLQIVKLNGQTETDVELIFETIDGTAQSTGRDNYNGYMCERRGLSKERVLSNTTESVWSTEISAYEHMLQTIICFHSENFVILLSVV